MAEAVVFGVVEKIVTDLGYLALQEIGSAWGVTKELNGLKDTVSTVRALLQHAEELQVHNPEVKVWLRRIKNVAYEAEDLIDEFSIEAMRQKRLSPIEKVRYFVPSENPILFRLNMAHRVKEVNRTFNKIASDKFFQLEVRIPVSEIMETHSYVDKCRVFGRENEKEKIVELLLGFDGFDRLSVLPIHGLGGIGKTTLAKLVFNDEQVDAHFKLKMWVFVSQKFDVYKIIKDIFQAATGKECPKLNMDLLQSRVREEIKGKRFLLVLDDVWNEDPENWDILKELLVEGASGSKIIVTTRSQKVASIMGTVSAQHLLGLSNDECWNLFKQRAFEVGQEERQPSLVEIGREIVRKCGGVPLAAKTLGSLLRSKKNDHEWLQVRDSDVWKLPQEESDILPSLRLSYNHMPFSLRRCFAYCSLFPKGCMLNKMSLVRFWIAQDFIISSDGEISTSEEIASQYVEELVWRSFFQDAKFKYDGVLEFKMHDLVHDLAQSVAGIECFTVRKDSKELIPEGVRHLHVEDESFPLETLEKPNLRTLIITTKSYYSIGNIISTLKFLRVLILKNYCDDYLPNSLCKLKHLRFLRVESQSLTKLPKSITKLQSLQLLNIWCEKLEELPKDLEKMTSLRHIWLHPDSPLTCMPIGIGNLVSLECLPLFVVGEGIGSKLNELNGLRNLGSQLTIRNLENVGSSRDTAEVNLVGKPKLVTLTLVWNEVHDGAQKEEAAFDVLATLEPHGNLKDLEIKGYEGAKFPNWMMMEESFLPNLTWVTLSTCRKCGTLPPLGQLQFLKTLELEKMDALTFIESRKGREPFPSLRRLHLRDLPNLKGWVIQKDGEEKEQPETSLLSLTCLVKLKVVNCPMLTTMPLVPSLELLYMEGCSDMLVQSILLPQQPFLPECNQTPLPKLKGLTVKHCHDLASLPLRSLTSLNFLEIINCPKLTSFTEEELQSLSSLFFLKVTECDNFTALSAGMRYLFSLETLHLEKLPKLVSLPKEIQKSTKLKYLSIIHCEGFMDLPGGLGNLTSLQNLTIWGCSKLESLPVSMQLLTNLQDLQICCYRLSWPNWLGKLTSITNLYISCPSDHLPEQLQHLTSLQVLEMGYCQGLESLPQWIANFSSLQYLRIVKCQGLQYLPDQMKKLTKLKSLKIEDCSKLTSRCKKGTGEDWSKVAHVPTIILQ